MAPGITKCSSSGKVSTVNPSMFLILIVPTAFSWTVPVFSTRAVSLTGPYSEKVASGAKLLMASCSTALPLMRWKTTAAMFCWTVAPETPEGNLGGVLEKIIEP